MHLSKLLTLFIACLSGALFGTGMIISEMVDPNKVIGFLNITGNWDPSLALVMGGALAVFTPFYHLVIKKRAIALNGDKLPSPVNQHIDRKLIIGATFFGAGWGLAGFCPGPAITSISGGSEIVLLFIASMLLGIIAANNYSKRTDQQNETVVIK